MARNRDEESTQKDLREDFRKDTKPAPDEACNAYYTRKQRTKANDLAPDTEMEYAPEDRDAEVDNYKSDRDAGPMNYKRWDRYGGK